MKSLFVVVVGCGRLGSHLAERLSRDGHRVVVIDKDETAFDHLAAETFSGFRVQGDASEPAVLQRADVPQADMLIAATHDDNLNLMVALVARRVFGLRHVMARVYEPTRQAVYHDMDVATVCPTVIAGELFFERVAEAAAGKSGRGQSA